MGAVHDSRHVEPRAYIRERPVCDAGRMAVNHGGEVERALGPRPERGRGVGEVEGGTVAVALLVVPI